MERRRLGTSGIEVPVVGMGTWRTFDVVSAADVEARRRVVDTAFEAGAPFFDSSPMYGRAERVLGHALEGRRNQAMVATKVWTPDDREAERQIAHSLGYYGGSVDLYQVHNLVAWERRLARLEDLRADGKVTAVGVTHYQHAAFPEIAQIMRSGRVAAIQVPYNVLDREVERELLPLAADLNIGVVVMRPLADGRLAVKPVRPELLEPLRDFGIRTWPQALLKWLLSDPRVTAVIPATRSVDHLFENSAGGIPPWLGPEERAYVQALAERVA